MSRLAPSLALTAPDDAAAASAVRADARAREERKRLMFVDLLRLLASFQMLHGHTLHALLAPELRSGPVFETWTFTRGLVSVGFLFAAGIAFTLSTLVDLEGFKSKPGRVAGRWRRIGWLILLGYSMHLPVEAWSADPERAARSVELFVMVDVLQCIGVSIALVQIVAQLAKKASTVVWAAAGLAVVFIGLAPLADAVPYDHWARPLANYLTHRGSSLFPLFPWSGFVMAGVAVTFLVAPRGAKTDPWVPVPRLLALAIGLYGLHLLAKAVPFTLADAETTSHSVPSFSILKLAAVVGIVVVLALLGTRIRRLPRVLQTLAGESLMLYWFHLMLLYGAGFGLVALIGPTLSVGEGIAVASGVVVLSFGVGLAWNRFKRWRATRKTRGSTGSRMPA